MKVKFIQGEENRIIREPYSQKDNSLFARQYEKGLKIVERLLCRGQDYKQEANVCENIILFTGDRGSGKTSCMTSLVGMLTEVFREKASFKALDIIDPSHFDEDCNIVSMVLGLIANDFDRNRKEHKSDESYEETQARENRARNLLADLNNLQRVLAATLDHKLTKYASGNQGLMDFVASVDLREKLRVVIDEYLEYIKKSYLVICIDDIDTNARLCIIMMEQIRKYLTLEKVIVFISVKIDQAVDAIKIKYEPDYRNIYTGDDKDSVIENIAYSYVDKVFPAANRVDL